MYNVVGGEEKSETLVVICKKTSGNNSKAHKSLNGPLKLTKHYIYPPVNLFSHSPKLLFKSFHSPLTSDLMLWLPLSHHQLHLYSYHLPSTPCSHMVTLAYRRENKHRSPQNLLHPPDLQYVNPPLSLSLYSNTIQV